MTFVDHFAARAAQYRAYRPVYPPALFDYLAGVVGGRELAWDCGTGNGQAARGLAPHFARVVATDASAAQIALAEPHERVEYRVAPAEASGLAAGVVDLVTAAQALHWFDRDGFFAEVRRVLRPGGAVAVWTYDDPELDDPALDAAVHRYSYETVGAYWPAERELVRERYRTIAFPFAERPAPVFTMEQRWTLAELVGYLSSWSATARYAAARGEDPIPAAAATLAAAWGPPEERRLVRWAVTVRVGY